MGALAGSLPKSLFVVGGRPVLDHQLEILDAAGIDEITVFVGYLGDAIEAHLARREPTSARTTVVCEPTPRGSGGCLSAAPDDRTLVVLLGDVMMHMDLTALLDSHRRSGAEATIAVHPNDHPWDSDLVDHDAAGRVRRIHRKPHAAGLLARNAVVAGVYVLEPSILRRIPRHAAADLTHDIIATAVDGGARVHAYATAEYLKDMGTPDRYRRVTEDYSSGRVLACHRSQRRRAAFIDRDGTLNQHVGHLRRADHIELLPMAARAIRRLNEAGVLAVCVTNQPVLARGECSEAELERIHAQLEMALGNEGAFLDAIYVCPHHPESGHLGEVSALKIECACRKPGTGMVDTALLDLNIDRDRSAVFGDTWRDLAMAENARMPGFLVSDTAPLEDAVKAWLAQSETSC